MSRFPLNSKVVQLRGSSVTVRELTYKQKVIWAKAVQLDNYCAPYLIASMVCDPPVTEEEAQDWPSQVLEEITEIAQRLSGMGQRQESEPKNA